MELKEALKLSEEELLAIKSPCNLFPRDKSGVISLARHLRSKWHPDKSRSASDPGALLSHLSQLEATALEQLEKGVWAGFKYIGYESATGGSTFEIKYLRSRRIPGFGTQFVGNKALVYHGEADVRDLADNWVTQIKILKEAIPKQSAKMAEAFGRYLKLEVKVHPLQNGEFLVKMDVPDGFVCLQDLAQMFPDGIPPEHTTWIMTRLYGLSGMMHAADVPNLCLDLHSLFVNPATHELMALGGWQYAKGFNGIALAAPPRTAHACNSLSRTGKPSVSDINRLIRKAGKACTNDPVGTKLYNDTTWPAPLRTWLLSQNVKGDPYKEFKAWEECREKSFPVRQFVKFPVDLDKVYSDN